MFKIDNVPDLQKLIISQAAEITRLNVEFENQKFLTDFWRESKISESKKIEALKRQYEVVLEDENTKEDMV